MPLLRHRMKALIACALLLGASACGEQVKIRPAFPPVADLAVENDCPQDDPLGELLTAKTGQRCKPVPTDAIVSSAQAAAKFDIAVEGWGERGWRAVARICRWVKEQGADLNCPNGERE